MSSTHEQLEHAEHAQHLVHTPFDKRVAMTIAIIAALLACVTMLSHRTHNDTLRLQNEANGFKIQSGEQKVLASNNWAWYQAKRLRQAQFESNIEQLPILAVAPGVESTREALISRYTKKVAEYKVELAEIEEKAKEAERESKEFEHKSEEAMHASHDSHHRGDRFDISELFVELGLVLCSVAVLTKRAGFWLSGMGSTVLGVVVALSVMFMH
jgi:hypothetical protein